MSTFDAKPKISAMSELRYPVATAELN